MGDNVTVDDRVYVVDEGLRRLREVMRNITGAPPEPNHYGTVEDIWDDGTVLINFDEGGEEAAGNAAPYPPEQVFLLPEPAHT